MPHHTPDSPCLDQLRAGQLAGCTRLDLSAGLTHFPPEIFELADTLEVLNLSGNALRDLPHDLHRLHRLRVLFCSHNAFTHLPESLGQCPQLSMVGFKANQIRHVPAAALPPALRWLILTDNALQALPDELGQRTALQKLMLAGNRLQTLPESLSQCSQLELLRIAANRLQALPTWLLDMPRLTWLAYAGNPFIADTEARAVQQAQAHAIDWDALTLQGTLGEGASGVIHEALWQQGGDQGTMPVAVKLFKGDMTSDGLPRSEMAACLAAGTHPHLIGVYGSVQSHPDGREGLLMQRIDAGCTPLAGPPSLASCTRDVYAPGQRFALHEVLQLAQGLASAAAHLHARGILHGDLYAHNTLWRAQTACLLGDFGAASFLPEQDAAMAHGLTRLEVRAIGCLLQELLALLVLSAPAAGAADDAGTLAALHQLQSQCMQPDPALRPDMAELAQQLHRLT